MSNGTSCTVASNCTIVDGATTNGTFWVTAYNASAPVPYWHQRMELATICVANSLSLIIIAGRLWYRWAWLKRFRGDDRWIATAGFFLVGYTASQIGTNIYGSGLHMDNVPNGWLEMHWHFSFGWAGYYIVTSCIKLSVCSTFIDILPHHFRGLRYTVFGLAVCIASLGITMTLSWIFQCTPFISNFDWNVNSTSCVNYDIFRWLWIGLSLFIDIVILVVPLKILKQLQIKEYERRILRLLFSATLLGTITCALGIYGVWETRVTEANDGFYHETAFIMFNDIEIFMYTLGASFPVLSRHLVSRANPSRTSHTNFSSWARHIPDLFLSAAAASHTRPNQNSALSARHPTSPPSVKSFDHSDQTDPEIEVGCHDTSLSDKTPAN